MSELAPWLASLGDLGLAALGGLVLAALGSFGLAALGDLGLAALGGLGLTELADVRLAHPERLFWLLPFALVPVVAALRGAEAFPWPAIAELEQAGGARRDVRRPLGAALRALAIACLALVIAEPRASREWPPEPGLGLDLVIALDASPSMAALEAGPSADGARTRLELARDAVSRFAANRVFAGDRVGLVAFGDVAFTVCPLTHDRALLDDALRRVAVGVAGEATALGDALALAVERATAGGDRSQGGIVLLLSDGKSNTGEIPVSVATALAAAADVRVHTVAIGGDTGEVAVDSAAGLRFERHESDPETLRRIAEQTGGQAFDAASPSDLLAVQALIDRHERHARPLPPRREERPSPEPLLAVAGLLVLAEIALLRGPARTLP